MIKQGTIFYGIQPEMVMCHIEIKSIFEKFGFDCIPTSIIGKAHKKGSLHPPGYAIDYRTKHVTGSKRKQKITLLMAKLKAMLPMCDFIFESEGKPQEHIHAEYDPKDDIKFTKAKQLYKLNVEWPR